MYKVLIVDDDSLERLHLKNDIDWEKLQCSSVEEAFDGLDAVGKIRSQTPDLVITDIEMPRMNGVELISYLAGHFPDVVVIALSAYDDFQYVRGSLKNGAADYLLKNQLTKENCEKVLAAALASADRKKEKSAATPALSVLEKVLEGDEEIQEYDRFSYYVLAVITVCDRKADEKRKHYIESIVRETLMIYDWKFQICRWEDTFAALFGYDTYPLLQDIRDVLEQVRDNIANFAMVQIDFALSSAFQKLTDGRYVYDSLCRTKDTEKEEDSGIGDILSIEKMQKWDAALQQGDRGRIVYTVYDIFTAIGKKELSRREASIILIEFFNVIRRRADRLVQSNRVRHFIRSMDKDQKESTVTSSDDLKSLILKYGTGYVELQAAQSAEGYHSIVRDAAAYIRQHYTENISLRDVADNIGVNKDYLSRLFKNDTGENVVEFINTLRMQYAMVQIKESDKALKEIAPSVGIGNYARFYKLFKLYYGISPSDVSR